MRTITLALALASVVALSGCGQNTPADKQTTTPEQKTGRQVIETRPEASGEQLRIHRFDESGLEFETEITYRDGTRGLERLNTLSGAVRDFTRTSKSGVVLEVTKFSADGRQIISKEVRFPSGKMQERLEANKNERKVNRFFDSGELQEEAILRADGSGSQTRWVKSRDKTYMYVKQTWNAAGDNLIEQYDANGNVVRSFAHTKNELVCTSYGADGKVLVRQHLNRRSEEEMRQAPFQGQWRLLSVEVMSADGKTVARTVYFDNQPFPRQPNRAVVTKPDGSIREVVSDGKDNVRVFVTDSAGKREDKAEASDLDLLKVDFRMIQQPAGFSPELRKYIESLFQASR